MAGHTEFGRAAEDAACRYLEAQGLSLLQRNFRVAGGEIDLVMADGPVVVFIEVRARSHGEFMHPAESITARKRGRLIHAARHYLQGTRQIDTARTRFDVVCIRGTPPEPDGIEWIRRAFDA